MVRFDSQQQYVSNLVSQRRHRVRRLSKGPFSLTSFCGKVQGSIVNVISVAVLEERIKTILMFLHSIKL